MWTGCPTYRNDLTVMSSRRLHGRGVASLFDMLQRNVQQFRQTFRPSCRRACRVRLKVRLRPFVREWDVWSLWLVIGLAVELIGDIESLARASTEIEELHVVRSMGGRVPVTKHHFSKVTS